MSPAPVERTMTDLTTHFDDVTWLHFARGILPASHERAMRAHLDHGCDECQRAHLSWKRFVEAAGRDAADSPDGVAKAVFALRRRIPFRDGLALLAEQVFDSFQDPLPVGIRGSAAAPRQLVYEAGGYLIDVRLEQGTDGLSTLTGQVVHAWTEGATRGTGVVVVGQNAIVGQTVANSIGEFQLDCEHFDNLKICLGISDETFIEVTLPNAARPGANGRR